MRSLLHQRLIALLLLVAYAITGTSLLPAVVSLAATAEGSHAVQVGRSAASTQVVLHHRAAEYTPATNDHATPLARLIVSLCRPSAEGDHSLSIQSMSGSLLVSRDEVKREIKDTPALNLPATVAWVATQLFPVCSMQPVVPACFAAADKLSQQRVLATVRLLI